MSTYTDAQQYALAIARACAAETEAAPATDRVADLVVETINRHGSAGLVCLALALGRDLADAYTLLAHRQGESVEELFDRMAVAQLDDGEEV